MSATPARTSARTRISTRAVAVGIFVVTVILAGVVSFYAASTPDGLTKVSEDEGFADTETEHGTGDGPFAGYGSSFIDDERLSGGVAGVVGVVVVLALAGGLTLVLRRRSPESGHGSGHTAESTSS
ncbi:PDGLE domain-containing protein [Nocardioides sp. 1609]|uniref:PDGLE domain-containing protein n=1 Tax=Nocardioides sp. 1609 TaxID=2508327 RepID=UPI00106FA4BF|nr:PDGLE domain-containing protein [Nocardioides sp. 1609]